MKLQATCTNTADRAGWRRDAAASRTALQRKLKKIAPSNCGMRASRTLLVEVPFTQFDVPSLEVAVSLWEWAWPCHRAPLTPSRPDLVFAFNGNISDPRHEGSRSRVLALARRPVISTCFGDVTLESANLLGSEDIYDKRRLSANWTVGPNNLFFKLLHQSAAAGYRFMMQLEPDILPLRPRWLEELHA
eukprot:5720283-Prymnesium_polylepis.1